jgi:hypothetical protein
LKKNLVGPGKGNGIKEDTVVVMDGSGSVGYCEFNKGRQALANLIKIGNDGGHDTRFACVTYSSGATTNFGFYPPAKASALMRSISYPNGGTNTQLGLAYAKTLMKGNVYINTNNFSPKWKFFRSVSLPFHVLAALMHALEYVVSIWCPCKINPKCTSQQTFTFEKTPFI